MGTVSDIYRDIEGNPYIVLSGSYEEYAIGSLPIACVCMIFGDNEGIQKVFSLLLLGAWAASVIHFFS